MVPWGLEITMEMKRGWRRGAPPLPQGASSRTCSSPSHFLRAIAAFKACFLSTIEAVMIETPKTGKFLSSFLEGRGKRAGLVLMDLVSELIRGVSINQNSNPLVLFMFIHDNYSSASAAQTSPTYTVLHASRVGRAFEGRSSWGQFPPGRG